MQDFPCDIVNAFSSDSVDQHERTVENIKRAKAIGLSAWISEQAEKGPTVYPGESCERMKVLIAYYSRTGNNEKLVNELHAKMGCDVEKIVDTVNRKGVWGFLKSGMQAYRKKMSRIEPIEKDPSSYDLVIIAYPLWSSLMPPPIRTYIFENKSKFNRVVLMSVSGSGEGNNKTIPDFEAAVGKKASATLMLKEAELKQGGYAKKLQEFSESISKLTGS